MKKDQKLSLAKTMIKDIRVWILIYFLIRLIGILNPPLEVAHNWRQVTVNMVARNYFEIDPNLFYPRVDMAGEKTGITGMEFPLLNYLIFIVSQLFGFDHWYGRLINLFVSSLGIFYFYLIVKKQFSPKLALISGIIMLNSIWFCYSRKIMPDTFSVSITLIGLYYALEYLYQNNNILNLFLYVLFGVLGVLSKIPALVILTVLCVPIFDKSVNSKRKLFLIASTILILIPVIAWYFYWVPYLVTEYGFWHYYMGTTFNKGFYEILSNLDLVAKKFYFEALKFSGFALFILGLYFLIRKSNKKLILVLLITTIVFLFFVIIAGRGFYGHSYYIIPYVPIMALIAAFAINAFRMKWIRNSILAIIILEGLLNQYHDFRIKKEDSYRLSLEKIADSICKQNDLIAINGGINPRDIYFTHRKGWTISNEEMYNIGLLNELAKKGCKYLFIDKKAIDYKLPELPLIRVYEDKNYSIFQF
jgi:hypothetical protein